jgi:ParB/RepB/Spo0J family partition protein
MSANDTVQAVAAELRTLSVVEIPIGQLVVEKEWNPRRKYREIDELAADMGQTGVQTTPCLVAKRPDGKYVLVAGFRRVMAIKKLKWPCVRVQVIEPRSAGDLRMANLEENIHRDNLTSFEVAIGLADYAKMEKLPEHGKGTAIAKRLGFVGDAGRLSQSTVNNLLRAVDKLIQPCMDAWANGQISQDAAFALAARDKQEQEEWLPKIKGMSGNTLRDRIEDLKNPIPEENGEEEEEKGEAGPKRPSRVALKKALAWAREHEFDDTERTIRWCLGALKTLTVKGNTFDPKSKPAKDEKSEKGEK